MLQNLHVKNLALIDETEVDFRNGLNILSGETGAGKSIIIGSINLALGEKVQKEMLRENADYALVELIFSVTDEKQKELRHAPELRPAGQPSRHGKQFVTGSERCRRTESHGQHEHQSLLSKKKHLEILDDYAKEEIFDPKEKLREAYKNYRALLEELKAADVDEEERLREISFLEYEIKEIEDADLKEGEDEALEADYRKFSNGKKIMEAVNAAYQYTGNQSDNVSELTGRALRELNAASAYDEKVKGLEEQLLEIDNLVNDFNRELADYIDETEFDDETFYRMEKRLDELNHLKSKYGSTIADILSELEKKQGRLQQLQDFDQYIGNLKQKFADAEQDLKKYCDKVSKIRKKYAKKLTGAVTEALKDLNFLDVKFEMEFGQTADYTANGTDDPEFLISTNPGEPVKPLGKVASGGELSRIMLAIKTVLADQDAIETLIFDEIDSGISGRTAQMVSEKMNVLAKNHQIICITHLPQIAAMADAHYLIEKSVENKTTVSKIKCLSGEESIDELARMLGGVEITDKVRESAREMKELAYQKKCH